VFKRILVPIDLSDKNARTLGTALMLASRSRARVILLHVIQRIPDIPLREMQPFYRRLVETSTRKLAEDAKPFVAQRLSVRTQVLVGEPAREIVREALASKIDLVVMGSHKVNPARRRSRGWGTTSYKVGIFCQCPILLIK
jgi:nucleotide-binding universal stress UspA family protein